MEEIYPPGWVETHDNGQGFGSFERHLMTQPSPDALKEVICSRWIKVIRQEHVQGPSGSGCSK